MDPVELLDMVADVRFPEGPLDHRRLDVGVAHGFHYGEWIGARHGYLLSKGVAQAVDSNSQDVYAKNL